MPCQQQLQGCLGRLPEKGRLSRHCCLAQATNVHNKQQQATAPHVSFGRCLTKLLFVRKFQHLPPHAPPPGYASLPASVPHPALVAAGRCHPIITCCKGTQGRPACINLHGYNVASRRTCRRGRADHVVKVLVCIACDGTPTRLIGCTGAGQGGEMMEEAVSVQ